MKSFICIFALSLFVAALVPIAAQDYGYDGYGGDEYEMPEDYGYGYEEEEAGEVDEKDVFVATDDNFQDLIASNKHVLVEFYAPWCGHCKALAPEYAMAATELKEMDAPMNEIVLAKVDATVHEELAGSFEVQGYPTLFMFVEGEKTDYEGGRTAVDIVQYLKKLTGPPAETVETVEELVLFQDVEGRIAKVFGCFTAFEGTAWEGFQATARHMMSMEFGQSSVKAVCDKLGLSMGSVAVLKGDATVSDAYPGELSPEEVENIAKFLSAERLPLVIPFAEENLEMIFNSGIERQIVSFGSTDVLEESNAMLAEAAFDVKGEVMFVTVNTDEERASEIMDFFKLSESSVLQAVGFRAEEESSEKYKYTEATMDAEGMKAFAKKLAAGEVEPDYPSEEPPESNDGPVTVVVGKTVDSICKDPTKDVMLEVYAPWCGHCKELEPVYRKLGQRFKNVDSVVIAKMDGTANEHKDIKVQGFPTILFFPAEENAEILHFEDSNTLIGLTKYIKSVAKIPYELKKKKGAETDEEGLETLQGPTGDEVKDEL